MNQSTLKEYFSRELGFKWRRQYQSQAVFELLIAAGEFCKNGVILDAGAGRQRYKPFFEESIYITQEHHSGIELKNMRDIEYDFISPIDEKIPLKDECLDGVLSTSVIEHLRYPDKFIREAYRVLKPGKKIFINAPFVHFEHEAPFDFNRPTRFGLEGWLKDAGFGEIVIRPASSSTETICRVLPHALRNDIAKSNKCRQEILNELFQSKGKNKYRRILFTLTRFLFAKLIYILSTVFCALIKFLIDRGPHSDTSFPVGWIAVATKPGNCGRRVFFNDKNEFLNQCKL